MKKLRFLVIFAVLVCTVFALCICSNAATYSGNCGANGSNLTWALDTTTGELKIDGTGKMKDWSYSVYVPWYSHRSSIKTAALGEGVTSVGRCAFENCSSLTSVSMPSVTSIGGSAFSGCDSLTSVDMPYVESIGGSAFGGCSSLTSVSMPSVTSIDSDAFYSCSSLTSVELPATVTSIGVGAFYFCVAMTNITVDEANTNYSSDKYGVLFNKDKTTLIQYPIGNSRTTYTVPNSVTSIGIEAFRNCDSLASVSIPSVTSIGMFAFYECSSLTSVSMPSVTSIDNHAFSCCSSLTSVSMPSVTSIGMFAFNDCSSLTSVSMPSVTTIGGAAFAWCVALPSVEMPASVTSIGIQAFEYCTNLKKATIYSRTVTFDINVFKNTHADFEIHGYTGSTAKAYANNNNHTFVPLREITAQGYCGGEGDGTNLSWVLYTDGELKIDGTGKMKKYLTIPGPGYSGALCVNANPTWYSYRTYIKTVIIGEDVTTVGSYAFYNCTSLTSVEMPSVTTLGYGAFDNCTALANVDMPSIISINEHAFYKCYALTSVHLPASVTSIDDMAFYSCTGLESIIVDEANTNYSNDEYGVLFNKDKTTLVKYPINNSCTNYILPNSTTTIGSLAFNDCYALVSIEMSNITSIEFGAFFDCSSLEKATIYSKTATFGSNIFTNTHEDFTIYGYAGSTAEAYAAENNHTFVPLKCVGEHDYEIDTNLSTSPTCIDGGTTVEICSLCSDRKETPVGKLGHDFTVELENVSADCENGGRITMKCSRCTETDTEELPMLGHDEIPHSAQEQGCTNIGWDAYVTCSRCDYSTYEELPMLGHDEIPHNAQEQGCTNIGWDAYVTCSRCDYSTYEELPMLGHDEIPHFAQEQRCTNIGWDAYVTCSRCDYSTYEELPMLGHDEIPHAAQAQGCENIGWEAYVTCSRCEYSTYEELPELGHDWFKAGRANGTWLYECKVCHDTEPRPFEFLPGDADGSGYVTIRDATLILQYIAGWEVGIDEDAADADGNSAITIRDATIILQFIADWDVTLG